MDGDRLLARITERKTEESTDRLSRKRDSIQQLDIYSLDGFFRASASTPPTNPGGFAKVSMQITGGSALSLVLRESQGLKERQPDSSKQPPRFVLQPIDSKLRSIETRIEIGSPQSIDALTPGLYRYLAWTNRSQVVEGEIKLEKLKPASLDIQFVPCPTSGEIRVQIEGSIAADSNTDENRNLFLLLESTEGPERMFVAQSAQLSIVSPDTPITWSVDEGKNIGTAVFRDIPNGTYQLSTAPGFGLSPETSLVTVGELVELKLFNRKPIN
ncbi:MAG: hypothetical protein ACI8TQ_003250 [Planctomycetota bacterium]|jgi:hypothetical protein